MISVLSVLALTAITPQLTTEVTHWSSEIASGGKIQGFARETTPPFGHPSGGGEFFEWALRLNSPPPEGCPKGGVVASDKTIAFTAESKVDFNYESRKGLTISSGGVQLVRGSFFQYYAPGWTKGYYSSNWNEQTVKTNSDGTVTVSFSGPNGLASGEQIYRPVSGGFDIEYTFNWNGDEPALIESTLGIMRAAPFTAGSVGIGAEKLPVGSARFGEEEARRFFPNASREIEFDGPFGKINWGSSEEFRAFDARGYNQDWADDAPTFWVGHPAISVKKGEPTKLMASFRFTKGEQKAAPALKIQPKLIPVEKAAEPFQPEGVKHLQLSGKPKLDWRGIHLFVGPQSEEIHRKFAENVLPKLKLNYVVLQCERTNWDAIPGTWTGQTTKKEVLKRIFDRYRKNGIEPIPMIQSFGHMEWIFANGKNLNLAHNPAVPYAIDPRIPEARAKVFEIWDEAIRLLNPKWIHFGLDEVDMRGFPENSAPLTTELWRLWIPQLFDYAKANKKEAMLWGDKMLAPGQAPDAATARTSRSPRLAAKF